MSVAVPHIPGDGRLDTLLDNQLDSSVYQLGNYSIDIVNEHTNKYIAILHSQLTKLQHSCISQLGKSII